MNINDILFSGSEYDVRIVSGERWLYGDRDVVSGNLFYGVSERKRGQKTTRCLIETESEDEAVRYLVGLKD